MLFRSTTGSNNIIFGRDAGRDTVANVTTQNNYIVMGNDSATNAYIKISWTVTSDARDKIILGGVPIGLDFIKALNPVKYQFKKSRFNETAAGPVRYGFLAQDMAALEGDEKVIIDANDPENLKYNDSHMTPVLVKAIQELSEQNKELLRRIEQLESTK